MILDASESRRRYPFIQASGLIRTVFLFLGLLGLDCIGNGERQELAFPFPLYTQELRIDFATEEAGQRAILELEPLYAGHTRAVSARFDDNDGSNHKVKAVLDAKGSRATWYLNSYTTSYAGATDYRPVARTLLEGGHSIGGHGYTHPYIGYTNRNRMFQEMAQVRIEWEAEIDTLLNSYAFSFVNYRNPLEGEERHRDVIRSLERAGFYHLSVFKTFDDQLPSELIISLIMPPENQPFEVFRESVDWAMNSDNLLERFRNVSHSMHAWYDSPRATYGLDEFERRVDYMNSHPDLWQCNQNQYAAYRYQVLHSTLSASGQQGSRSAWRLSRPRLRYLNDPIPLTLSIKGVELNEIKAISLDGEPLGLADAGVSRSLRVNLPHTGSQSLPRKTGHVANPDNRQLDTAVSTDPDFPGLSAVLRFDGQHLFLVMDNQSGEPVSDAVVTFRLPLAWKEGVHHVDLPDLPAGDSWSHQWTPTLEHESPKHTGGVHYFVAQVDFHHGRTPARLYATCQYAVPFDASFPRDGFLVMGPIEPGQIDMDLLGRLIGENNGRPPRILPLKDGTTISWQDPSLPMPVPAAHFDPEVIPTTGDWFQAYSPVHLLHSIVYCPDDRPAQLVADRHSLKAVFLNGQLVADPVLPLKAGRNFLVLVHDHHAFTGSGEHAAAFLRITHPQSPQRITGLTFLRPPFP